MAAISSPSDNPKLLAWLATIIVVLLAAYLYLAVAGMPAITHLKRLSDQQGENILTLRTLVQRTGARGR